MQEIEIIDEQPLTLSEMKEKLGKINKEDLSFRATKSLEYLKSFGKTKPEKISEKKKKIDELNIQRLKQTTISKIIDLNPTDEDSLKTILSVDHITLKQEDLKRIIEVIK
tara:strand:- start:70 stop:399 length:330 start_codon:yes stop_codon:yes gene_type:complete